MLLVFADKIVEYLSMVLQNLKSLNNEHRGTSSTRKKIVSRIRKSYNLRMAEPFYTEKNICLKP